jgi:hypothetical protein
VLPLRIAGRSMAALPDIVCKTLLGSSGPNQRRSIYVTWDGARPRSTPRPICRCAAAAEPNCAKIQIAFGTNEVFDRRSHDIPSQKSLGPRRVDRGEQSAYHANHQLSALHEFAPQLCSRKKRTRSTVKGCSRSSFLIGLRFDQKSL